LFEDFGFPELRVILDKQIKKYQWSLEVQKNFHSNIYLLSFTLNKAISPVKDARVVDVAARRIARGRGVKGFANARSCRTAHEKAYQVIPILRESNRRIALLSHFKPLSAPFCSLIS